VPVFLRGIIVFLLWKLCVKGGFALGLRGGGWDFIFAPIWIYALFLLCKSAWGGVKKLMPKPAE